MDSDFGFEDLGDQPLGGDQIDDNDAVSDFGGDAWGGSPADDLLSAALDGADDAADAIEDLLAGRDLDALDDDALDDDALDDDALDDDPGELSETAEGVVAGSVASSFDFPGSAGSFFTFVQDAQDDDLHGELELEWAQAQSENGFCVPTSVAMVVSEMTGSEVSEDAAVDAATDLDLLYGEPGAWIGMTSYGTVDLLAHFGVDADVEFGEVDDLNEYLDEGRNIIVSVDASEIWYSDGQTYDPGNELPHAAVITAIDADAGVVYLNDPGVPADVGAGMEVPLETFLGAWEDTGNEMVVTVDPTPGFDSADVTDPTGLDTAEALPLDPAAADADLGALGGHLAPIGMVILPVSFVVASATLAGAARQRHDSSPF